MTLQKRLFDLLVAILLGICLVPVIAIVYLVIRLLDGGPVFYVSERMSTQTKGFALIKFRTMTVVAKDAGVSGGDKSNRVTRTGRILRRSRLDEVPQLWNVLRGDISFVGPRPPLRQYVEKFPEVYSEVLKSRPGITGLASVYFHAHEEHLLARSTTGEQTEDIYCRCCIPRKARLDLIYQKRSNLCFDMLIMLQTVFKRIR